MSLHSLHYPLNSAEVEQRSSPTLSICYLANHSEYSEFIPPQSIHLKPKHHQEEDLISVHSGTTSLMIDDEMDETMKSFIHCNCSTCKEFVIQFQRLLKR